MDYQNKKRKSRNSVFSKRKQKKHEDKLQKEVDDINWKNRERLEPLKSVRDQSQKAEQSGEATGEE